MGETQDQEAIDLQAISDALTALTTQLGTIKQGILDLETALAAAGGTTPAVDTALANLKTAAAGATAAGTDAAAALPPPPAKAP